MLTQMFQERHVRDHCLYELSNLCRKFVFGKIYSSIYVMKSICRREFHLNQYLYIDADICLVCDKCGVFYNGDCPKHNNLLPIGDCDGPLFSR